MSVCRKHRRGGRLSCSCPKARTVRGDGYGGPDVSTMTDAAFNALSDYSTSGFGSSSYDSSSSSSSSSYDSSGSSSGSSDGS